MPEDEDFYINYQGANVRVSPVLNGGNIFFIVHLATKVVIAEGMMNGEWVWQEAGEGDTPRAAALGAIIESLDD